MKPGTRARNRAAVDRYQREHRERYLADRRAARARRAASRPPQSFACVACPQSFETFMARGHHEGKAHPGLIPPHRAERRQAMSRANRGTDEYRARQRAYRMLHREKALARLAVWNAVQRGVLARTPCVVCGTTPVHGHHHVGYDRPLDVTWLCATHHREAHRDAA